MALGVTLGAISGKGRVTIPGVETLYWIPCSMYLPVPDERGKPISHVHFIASSESPTTLCPECRAKPRGSRRIEWPVEKATDGAIGDLPF